MYIKTFGGLAFSNKQIWFCPSLGASMYELLAALIHQEGRPISSDVLMENIWPSQNSSKSSSALNTLIWRTNKLLSGNSMFASSKTIQRQREHVVLNCESLTGTDFGDLSQVISKLEAKVTSQIEFSSNEIITLIETLENYLGDFLPELQSAWALVVREKYRSYFIRGCQLSIQYFSSKNSYDRAISYAKKILLVNPYRESTRRQLIWLYVMNGQRKEAKQYYKNTISFLHDELGVTPMTETKAIASLINCENDEYDLLSKSFSNINRTAQENRLTVLNELMLLNE